MTKPKELPKWLTRYLNKHFEKVGSPERSAAEEGAKKVLRKLAATSENDLIFAEGYAFKRGVMNACVDSRHSVRNEVESGE